MATYVRERGGYVLTPPPSTASNGVRTPKAATLPLRTSFTKLGAGRGQLSNWDAGTAVENAFYMNVFVYRCVQLRAQLLSGLPIRVGADPDNPSDYDKSGSTPLARFLKGNTELPWRTIMAFASAQYDLTGRYAWELDLNGTQTPVAPYPLLAQYLTPIPTERGPAYFSGFEYNPKAGWYTTITTLNTKQCHYAWRPSQRDIRQPESPLESAGINVNVLIALDGYSYAFMRNDARPAAIITHEAFATEEETRNFRNQWLAEHKGTANAGKPAFIEFEPGDDASTAANAGAVIDVRSLGLSQRDAQMVQTLREEIRAVCITFGVPISALGDASERTYDNAGVEGRNLWELAMLPYKREHEDHINTKLAPLFDSSNVMWFDVSRVKALKDRKFSGILTPDVLFKAVTPNEIRADLDLPPLADGDMLLGLSAVPIAPETVTEDTPAETPLTIDADPNRAPETLHATITRTDTPALPAPKPLLNHGARHKGEHGPHTKPKFDYDAARAKALARHKRETQAQQKLWAKAFRNLLTKQEEHVISRMEGKRGRQRLEKRDANTDGVDLGAFYELNHRAEESKDVAAHLVEHAAVVGGSRLVDDFGVEFDVESETAQAFVEEVATRLGEQVVTYMADALTTTLTDGLNANEELPALNERVTAAFSEAKDELIPELTWEVPGVLNRAAFALVPPTALAEWVAADDHDHIDFDQVASVGGKPFRVGTTEAFPDLCGCTFIVWNEELAAARGKRIVELRTALAVLDMVEAKLITARQVRRTIRALEAA